MEIGAVAVDQVRLSSPTASTSARQQQVEALERLDGTLTMLGDDPEDFYIGPIELEFGPEAWVMTAGPSEDFDGDGNLERLLNELRGLVGRPVTALGPARQRRRRGERVPLERPDLSRQRGRAAALVGRGRRRDRCRNLGGGADRRGGRRRPRGPSSTNSNGRAPVTWRGRLTCSPPKGGSTRCSSIPPLESSTYA